MEKREELYRGKAKSVYKTDDADRLILLFRNDTSAFDGKRIEQLDRKGMVNNKFNAIIMQKLEAAGIPTQFDKLLADNEVLLGWLYVGGKPEKSKPEKKKRFDAESVLTAL